jgi:hypothetical protein
MSSEELLRSRFKFMFLPRAPVRKIKLGRLTKKGGIVLEMVASVELKTKLKSEFELWVNVLQRVGLVRSQTYSVVAPPDAEVVSPASHNSWSSRGGGGGGGVSDYGYEELKQVMDNFQSGTILEEEEELEEEELGALVLS